MGAFAGGALWTLLSLRASGDLAWFAFVVAMVTVWTLRAHGYAARWPGIALAPLCVALAAAYAFYLQAVTRVAGMLGISIREAFMKMHAGFAFDLARVNLNTASLTMVVVAAVLAMLAMCWPAANPPR